MQRRNTANAQAGKDPDRLVTSRTQPDFHLTASVTRQAGRLYIPEKYLFKYASYHILRNEYEILNVETPGFYLTPCGLYYVVPKTLRPLRSELPFLSNLSGNSSGLIHNKETHELAKFYLADLARLYTEMFS